MNRKILTISIYFAFVLLTGCGSTDASNNETIKIGVTGGPPEEITNIVKEEAEKEGIHLEVIKFNDIVTPNRALNSGELDLNMFQHKQYLDQYLADRNDALVPIGATYNSTAGIYSEKYESLDEIPDGATLGVPSDPSNLWRALLLYEEAGLITVKETEGTPRLDIIEENPRNFEFIEIDGGLMLRTLESIDAGVVASTSAFNQGLDPKNDSIYLETGTEFPMVVAVREEDKDNPDYKRITELYQSDAVKQYIEEKYKDVIVVIENPFQLD